MTGLLRRPVVAVAVAVAVLASACDRQPSGHVSSFASYAGVLGCAQVVVWASITRAEPAADGLEVSLAVQEWVVPPTGPATTTVTADDPAQEVAAPGWQASQDTWLVIALPGSPPEHLDRAEGERAVQVWREAGSPRQSDEQCARA